MSDSCAIDAALVEKLRSDATLQSLMPDGVFFGAGAPGLTRFIVVDLIAGEDRRLFDARDEDCLYLVKAVALNDDNGDARAAAARIDELLDPPYPAPPATLDVPGYGVMAISRVERIRMLDVDDEDNQIRWQHRGGQYQVLASPTE